MFEKSNFTENETWKKIDLTKFEQKKWKPDISRKEAISWNVEKLSNLFGMNNISDEVNDNVSKTSTKSLYEMFLTLYEPPSYYERLYSKTIYGPQLRLITLALNIVKMSPNEFKPKAKQIFSKITSIISKKHHDEMFKRRKDTPSVNGKLNLSPNPFIYFFNYR